MKTYPNFLQNGKRVPGYNTGLEFNVKQIIGIYYDINELFDKLQYKYKKSVENLQRITYRTFAAKCAYIYAKANMMDFTRFADVDAKQMEQFKDAAWDDRIKLKREQKEAEFEHINYTKPQYMSARYDDDRWQRIKEWVMDVCNDRLEKIEGEHPRDREKRIYQIAVRVYPMNCNWGNGVLYKIYIPQFDIEKEF